MSLRRRIARGVLLSIATIAATWHLLPLAVWFVRVGPELREAPNARRLEVPMLESFETPPADWESMRFGNVELRAPLDPAAPADCASGESQCFLVLHGGTLVVFPLGYLEPYVEVVNLRAPDRRDLSVSRSALENWATIEALRVRVLTSRASLESFRFATAQAKGVVARTERDGAQRYVVAAYSLDEGESRGIGVSGLSEATFLQLLGTLKFHP